MDSFESTPVPTEMLPNLLFAATELRELSSHLEFSEVMALDRGLNERNITPAELEIENRITRELERTPEHLRLIDRLPSRTRLRSIWEFRRCSRTHSSMKPAVSRSRKRLPAKARRSLRRPLP